MKDILLGFLIGGIVGLWVGVNLGKEQPIMSNPFGDSARVQELDKKFTELQKDLSEKSKEFYNDTKRAVDDALD